MMMQRSILIQLACLALVGSANAEYEFDACSGDNCASKSREACVLSLHRRWVCCSCLYFTMYSLRVYSVRYSKYLRSFPLDAILSVIIGTNSQSIARLKTAAKNAAAISVRVSLEKRLCYPCTGAGFAVAACTSPCTLCAYTRPGIPNTYVLFHLTLFYPSSLCTTRRRMHGCKLRPNVQRRELCG